MSATMSWSEPRTPGGGLTPSIKNHTATLVDNSLWVFGGYDGRRNHSAVHVYDCHTQTWRSAGSVGGKAPQGRNGHTATLAERKIFIIGGWLGAGPLAASDLHVLDVDRLVWAEPSVTGKPPGPCNMHTADYIAHLRQVFVFRGGDGREYLNDLHGLNVDTYHWEEVFTTGQGPRQRANHSSAVYLKKMYVFGGWDGTKRLNDIHVLDTETMDWSAPAIGGPLPKARAGMTFTRLRDRIYLFGGSGPSAKCFNDLQVFDPERLCWIETVPTSPSATTPTRPNRYPLDELDTSGQGQDDYEAEGGGGGGFANDDGLRSPPASPGRRSGGGGGGEANPNVAAASNPNEEEGAGERVVLYGAGPGRRAGHSATVVNRSLVVFGGSHGSDYINDFFVLDTDPPPVAAVTAPSCTKRLRSNLHDFVNSPSFSDVEFLVEGHRVYGHKVILSLLSERFRSMFSDENGFSEAVEGQVVVPDYSHKVFVLMLEYLYTGVLPDLRIDPGSPSFELAVELLGLSDQYLLDHLKQSCEQQLQAAVRDDTAEWLLEVADRSNAWQLQQVCRHHVRNRLGGGGAHGGELGEAAGVAEVDVGFEQEGGQEGL